MWDKKMANNMTSNCENDDTNRMTSWQNDCWNISTASPFVVAFVINILSCYHVSENHQSKLILWCHRDMSVHSIVDRIYKKYKFHILSYHDYNGIKSN